MPAVGDSCGACRVRVVLGGVLGRLALGDHVSRLIARALSYAGSADATAVSHKFAAPSHLGDGGGAMRAAGDPGVRIAQLAAELRSAPPERQRQIIAELRQFRAAAWWVARDVIECLAGLEANSSEYAALVPDFRGTLRAISIWPDAFHWDLLNRRRDERAAHRLARALTPPQARARLEHLLWQIHGVREAGLGGAGDVCRELVATCREHPGQVAVRALLTRVLYELTGEVAGVDQWFVGQLGSGDPLAHQAALEAVWRCHWFVSDAAPLLVAEYLSGDQGGDLAEKAFLLWRDADLLMPPLVEALDSPEGRRRDRAIRLIGALTEREGDSERPAGPECSPVKGARAAAPGRSAGS
jgi:hypothetical protein